MSAVEAKLARTRVKGNDKDTNGAIISIINAVLFRCRGCQVWQSSISSQMALFHKSLIIKAYSSYKAGGAAFRTRRLQAEQFRWNALSM